MIMSPNRDSYEGVVKSDLSLYDIGDINLFSNMCWCPCFTEAGRNWIDFRFDISHNLPFNFYIKSGKPLNYAAARRQVLLEATT